MISRIALAAMLIGPLAPAGFTQTAPSFELPAATGAYGAITSARASEVTRAIVREFFGQEILGQKSGLMTGEQQMDGVSVAQLRKPSI